MILDILGTILTLFIGFLVVIILIPIIILVIIYFALRKNPITLQTIWEYIKDIIAKILAMLKGKNVKSAKVNAPSANKVEDAEFIEIQEK